MARHRVAIGHAAHTGTDVQHRNRLIAVYQQGDFADQREHAGDLTQHTGFIHHGGAQFHATHLAPVQHHAARVGVGRVVDHLGRLGGCLQPVAQLQQFAQPLVFHRQLICLVGPLAHHGHFLAGGIQVILRGLQRLEIAAPVAGEFHGLQHEPLHGVQHRGHGLTEGAGDLKACIGHHEEKRQRAEHSQTRQGRRALFEERGSAALQSTQGHGAQRSGSAPWRRIHGRVLRNKHWSRCSHAIQSEKSACSIQARWLTRS